MIGWLIVVLVVCYRMKEKDEVECYESLFEVETGGLLKQGFRDCDDEVFKMEVETQDDVVLARILAQPGQEVPVGAPIAVLAEEEDEVEKVASLTDAEVNARLDEGDFKAFMWQAYHLPQQDQDQE